MSHRNKSSAQLDIAQLESVPHKRTKRLRIESDEGEDHDEDQSTKLHSQVKNHLGEGSLDNMAQLKRPRLATRKSEDDRIGGKGEPDSDEDGGDGNEDGDAPSSGVHAKRGSVPSSTVASSPPPSITNTAGGTSGHVPSSRARRMSTKGKYIESQPSSSSMTSAPKGKVADSGPSSTVKKRKRTTQQPVNKKKKARQVESEDEEDEEEEDSNFDDQESEDEQEEFSDEYDDYDEDDDKPSRGKSGRRSGVGGSKGGKAGAKEKDKDGVPVLKRAKFEGSSAALGTDTGGPVARRNSLHESTSGTSLTGIKRPRTKKLAEENSLIDVVGDSVTPEASTTATGSPSATGETKNKGESADTAPPPPKKRKLPTIKKMKATGSTAGGPSTSASTASGTKFPAAPLPLGGGAVIKLATDNKSTRPNAISTTDLDLSNPSLYAELFKNPGANASRTGSNRRAKEEERRKELDKMREEYRIKLAQDAKISFDLQGQAEKIARFEERLRQWHSSALYPNFLAAKWREEWEREKRRAHKREWQEQDGDNGTKEEGEM